jgi:hypothetical protein
VKRLERDHRALQAVALLEPGHLLTSDQGILPTCRSEEPENLIVTTLETKPKNATHCPGGVLRTFKLSR